MTSSDNTLDPEPALIGVPPGGSVTPVEFNIPPNWLETSRAALDVGADVAEQWLVTSTKENLWSSFARGRRVQNNLCDRTAFEVGFLNHLQQYLRAMPQ
ncbi:LasR-specific antiactivator QslA [Pseudomonas nicosulfuronedens]